MKRHTFLALAVALLTTPFAEATGESLPRVLS
jgi:hypothetical protein